MSFSIGCQAKNHPQFRWNVHPRKEAGQNGYPAEMTKIKPNPMPKPRKEEVQMLKNVYQRRA